MSLKHRQNTNFPATNEAPNKIFSDLFRTLQDVLKNIYDDLKSNGVVKYNFNSEVQLLAGLKMNRTAVTTSPYTVLLSDHLLGVDTSGARTLNLPAVADAGAGKEYIIKDETGTAGANNITIDGSGAETIDGAATLVINTNYGKARIYCTGSAWRTL